MLWLFCLWPDAQETAVRRQPREGMTREAIRDLTEIYFVVMMSRYIHRRLKNEFKGYEALGMRAVG
jgi:hypothetical protein